MDAVALAAGQLADLLLLVGSLEVECPYIGARPNLMLAEPEDIGPAEISSQTFLPESSASRLWST
jgi:hypothetical protein